MNELTPMEIALQMNLKLVELDQQIESLESELELHEDQNPKITNPDINVDDVEWQEWQNRYNEIRLVISDLDSRIDVLNYDLEEYCEKHDIAYGHF